MKLLSKKGQGALEYMQTYGWAILVVLIVGVVLWQFGIFGQHSGVNVATGFSKIKVLEPSIKYDSTDPDQLTFDIINGESMHIRILGNTSGGDCASTMTISNLGLDGGQTATVTCTGCMDLDASEAFDVPISIYYRIKIASDIIYRNDTGRIIGAVE
ncbi:MAG: hypothetical protein L6243_02080 [Candidatus Altiarchaeales archaeon]|nr:hypothetical protein [Candidatus Altiarchaeota archaeon]MCG2782358.1 hypothetical protein [Candidatus Altiarchaeales archaeon]